jgi:hypothetical protein
MTMATPTKLEQPIPTVAAGAVVADAPKPADKPKPEPTLKRGDAKLFEFQSNHWTVASIPAGVKPEQLDGYANGFWNALDELRELDQITACPKDRAWIAGFVVTHAHVGTVIVRLAWQVEGSRGLAAVGGAKPIPQGWQILRTGPDGEFGVDGWYGLREGGAKLLESGQPFRSYEDCRTALLQHPSLATEAPTKYFP